MVAVIRTVIRLGNFSDGIADIDPDGTGSTENAAALVSQTFTGATMSVETITYSDGNNDGFIDFDDTVGPGGTILRTTLEAVLFLKPSIRGSGTTSISCWGTVAPYRPVP